MFELDEIPGYVSAKHGLTPENGVSFLNSSSNSTQDDRELYDVWQYAHLFSSNQLGERRWHAVLQPKPDRGVDAYLRGIRVRPLRWADIPIQVAEIHLSDGGMSDFESFAAQQLLKAKGKKSYGIGWTLLCSLRGMGQVRADFDKLRRAFAAHTDWLFDRIVIIGTAATRSFAVTILVREGCGEHFYLRQNERGQVEGYVGKTVKEMNENWRRNRVGNVSIRY